MFSNLEGKLWNSLFVFVIVFVIDDQEFMAYAVLRAVYGIIWVGGEFSKTLLMCFWMLDVRRRGGGRVERERIGKNDGVSWGGIVQ